MESGKGRNHIAPKASGWPAVATGLAAATAGSMAWAVRGRSSAVFAPSEWRGDRARRSIALTFDDGPSPGTPTILEILAAHRVRATFFAVGRNVERHPAIAREVVAAGNDIENHSYTHPLFALKRPSFIEEDLTRAQDAIREAAGRTPRWLRAPYGVRWFGFRQAQANLGLKGVMWSVLGLDWKLPAPAIAGRVLALARGGDIICLHDGRGTLENPEVAPTIEAVRRIVPALLDAGYHFDTVSEILWPLTSLMTN